MNSDSSISSALSELPISKSIHSQTYFLSKQWSHLYKDSHPIVTSPFQHSYIHECISKARSFDVATPPFRSFYRLQSHIFQNFFMKIEDRSSSSQQNTVDDMKYFECPYNSMQLCREGQNVINQESLDSRSESTDAFKDSNQCNFLDNCPFCAVFDLIRVGSLNNQKIRSQIFFERCINMIQVPEEQQVSMYSSPIQHRISPEHNERLSIVLIIIIVLLLIPYYNPSPQATINIKEYQKQKWLGRVWNRHLNQYGAEAPLSYRTLIQTLTKQFGVDIKKYSNITADDIQELPICILTMAASPSELQRIRASVDQQSYSNFRFVEVASNASSFQQTGFNYYRLNRFIKKECIENSVLLFASDTLSAGTLQQLNKAYQTQSVWVFYSQSKDEFCIHSAYQRIFELIGIKDFELTNAHALGAVDPAIIALGIIQLSAWHALELPKDHKCQSFISLKLNMVFVHNRRPYNSLISLRHSFAVDNSKLHKWWKQLIQKLKEFSQSKSTFFFHNFMVTGIENAEMPYLPQNHSLFIRDKRKMNALSSKSGSIEELPLCVFVPSHNNIAQDRYKGVILSILQQQYSNYHIVFVDDSSDDRTMLETMRFVRRRGFPETRITYVRNLQQNHATYNLVNTAVNFCKDGEIQLMIDGDDELIGTQVFKLINFMYHKRDNWVVYTTFISNQYLFGNASPFRGLFESVNSEGKRIKGDWFDHVRSWSVALMKKVHIRDHKRQNGSWYNTLSDRAYQYPLLEMSTQQHIEYAPEVCYFYNHGYGDNDDSTNQKIIEREQLFQEILTRPIYSKVENLNFYEQNWELIEELSADYGIKYIEVTQDEALPFQSIRSSFKRGQSNKLKGINPLPIRDNEKQSQTLKSFNSSVPHMHPMPQFTGTNTRKLQSFSEYAKTNQLPQHIEINETSVNQTLLEMGRIREGSTDDSIESKMLRAYYLALEPYNRSYLSTEYYLLDKQFNIIKTVKQIPFCIILRGRNNRQFSHFQYDSILRQNYSNYRIHIIDDASDDGSVELLEAYIRTLPKKYRDRTTFTKNNRTKYALFNRNNAIRKHCSNGDLVLDFDGDDRLIGNQVLNLLNHRFRHNQSLWLLYSSSLSVVPGEGLQHESLEFPEDVVAQNRFRQWGHFSASGPKVFSFELYRKMDESDFLDQFGSYYKENFDMFVQYALLEMACPEHCQQLDQFISLRNSAQQRPQPRLRQSRQQSIVRTLIPYTKLDQLNDPPQRMIENENQLQKQALRKFLSDLTQIEVSPYKKNDGQSACVIGTFESIPEMESFVDSLIQLRYTHSRNYKFVNFAALDIDNKTASEFAFKNFKHFQIQNTKEEPNESPLHFREIFELIRTQCVGSKYVVFASALFRQNGLQSLLGALEGHEDAWVLYDASDEGLYANIYAVRKSVFEQIGEKKMLIQKDKQLMAQNMDYLPLALLRICSGHIAQMDQREFFEEQFESIVGININENSQNRIASELSIEKSKI